MSVSRHQAFPLHVALPGLLALAVRLPWPGSSDPGRAAALAVAGGIAAAAVALTAGRLAGPRGGGAAGLLVALSPIHTLACREGSADGFLTVLIALSLWTTDRVETRGRPGLAVALGTLLGGAATVSATGALLALLQWLWLVTRRDRAHAAAVSLGVAVLVFVSAVALGQPCLPLLTGTETGLAPASTPLGVVRCAGASFTRLAGLEYQLVVSHARYLAPVTLLSIVMALHGAGHLPSRSRWLLLGGVGLPFAGAIVLAVLLGRVTPLQAHRLMPALPFLAVLVGAGLAALRGWRRRAATGLLVGASGVFLGLALVASR